MEPKGEPEMHPKWTKISVGEAQGVEKAHKMNQNGTCEITLNYDTEKGGQNTPGTRICRGVFR